MNKKSKTLICLLFTVKSCFTQEISVNKLKFNYLKYNLKTK